MKIAIDAMGGDFAPFETVKGALMAASSRNDINILLIGDEKRILDVHEVTNSKIPSNIEIIHTDTYISMQDDPMSVIKEKSDSSMAIGLKILKDGVADAFLSAGNTGALHAGSTLTVRKIKGIRRSAIATLLPFKSPILMLDAGANPTVSSDVLHQWAILGSRYAELMFGIDRPRVGLLNIGVEEHKGTDVTKDAYCALSDDKRINFVGNVESNQLLYSPCDVLVTDGFTGNVVLKLFEGSGRFLHDYLKEIYSKNAFTRLSFLSVKDGLEEFNKMFDASLFGCAPLLGLSKPVIKAHGSSKAIDIKNAVIEASKYYEFEIIQKIEEILQ
jgi:glycerol-3-phosphate acyltransferase PlsX